MNRLSKIAARAGFDVLIVAAALAACFIIVCIAVRIPGVAEVVLRPSPVPFLILTLVPSFIGLLLNRLLTPKGMNR